ncbi:alpha/beta fold hydrolase [Streptomyces sp. NPDC048639]|uniref:alpha/beta fold hydrolase n=1 Tax=Streptomyces sp. NPDC048639 TaxID=3365581 RepID=UPI003721FBCE
MPGLTRLGLRVTTFDLLGFGYSDKPRRHRYSLLEQADLVEDLWRRLGIGDTALVAHDYGVSVAQELLARSPHRITRTAWLNGASTPICTGRSASSGCSTGRWDRCSPTRSASVASAPRCAGSWAGRSRTARCTRCGTASPSTGASCWLRSCCATSTSDACTRPDGSRPWRATGVRPSSCGALPIRSAVLMSSPVSGNACRTRRWRNSEDRPPSATTPRSRPRRRSAPSSVHSSPAPELDGRGRVVHAAPWPRPPDSPSGGCALKAREARRRRYGRPGAILCSAAGNHAVARPGRTQKSPPRNCEQDLDRRPEAEGGLAGRRSACEARCDLLLRVSFGVTVGGSVARVVSGDGDPPVFGPLVSRWCGHRLR